MELKNIIYSNLITILDNLTPNGGDFDAFYNGLNEEKDDLFNLSQDIDLELKKIQKSKLDGVLHPDFSDVLALLNKFEQLYSSYPNHRVFEAIVIIYFINSLSEAIDEDISLDDEYAIENFELTKLIKETHQRNFAYYDSHNLTNSLILLDFSNTEKIANYYAENPLPKELIIQLLAFIGNPGVILEETQYVLSNKNIANKPNQIWSVLGVHIVKNGKLVHQPHNYQVPPTVNPIRLINQETSYQQFDDSILILSEYNHQHDILDKYLRIYHLIENFMYKYPLTQLERKYAGNVFSIRDFQRMHDVVNNNEIISIKNLIKAVSTKEYIPGKTFSKFIHEKWSDLFPNEIADKAKIDLLLSYLRLDNTFDTVAADQINVHIFFAKLVYAFRNSLVHNRETEFHLTHETLLNHSTVQNTAQIILEKFILPVVEDIVFYLIIQQNDLVWFTNPTLKLYNEN